MCVTEMTLSTLLLSKEELPISKSCLLMIMSMELIISDHVNGNHH